jgi:N-methylhydantoinase A
MPEHPPYPLSVGVDTGGTFTDFFFVDSSGTTRVDKRPSCPQDPARPVLDGLLSLPPGTAHRVVHGTTVATNALLENKVAKTALITTAGFEDILEIGRQNRPDLYAIHPRKTPPLIPRDLRFGVRERILHDGTVLLPIDPDEVSALLRQIKDLQVTALAVCLLHSYANPVHEELIGSLAEHMHFAVSVSCQVQREFREYERTATVAVNAALRPIMEGYLNRIEGGMRGAHLSVMQSAGGTLPPRTAARFPVHTILSGPAGGVIAAAHTAAMAGLDRIITFDMGGTSTDVSLYDRAPGMASGRVIGGHPVRVPVIDIHTVGAGGGSIAYRDAGGGLKVGPISAGADPGPVCYGKGNALTVTDANFFLGRMETSSFLGGRMKVDTGRIRGPLELLADSLGLGAAETAEGIVTVVNTVMERAIRVISIQRGHDPKNFTLLSFGGSGGLHAVALAQSLGIPQVLIPLNPGVFSAIGMAGAQISRDFSRTVLARTDTLTPNELNALIQELAATGLAEFVGEGIPEERVMVTASLDMRYRGQSHELGVPARSDPHSAFHDAHHTLYGFRREDSPVEIVTIRVRLTAQESPLQDPDTLVGSGSGHPIARRHLTYAGQLICAEVYDRKDLPPAAALQGPALVVEATATTFIPPASSASIDSHGNIIITLGDFLLDSKPG